MPARGRGNRRSDVSFRYGRQGTILVKRKRDLLPAREQARVQGDYEGLASLAHYDLNVPQFSAQVKTLAIVRRNLTEVLAVIPNEPVAIT